MSRAWLSFVHDLDPNNHGISGLPVWPAYDSDDPVNMVFRTGDNHMGPYIESDVYRSQQLRWWNEHWELLRT